jgi:hypothetical protein
MKGPFSEKDWDNTICVGQVWVDPRAEPPLHSVYKITAVNDDALGRSRIVMHWLDDGMMGRSGWKGCENDLLLETDFELADWLVSGEEK